MSFRKDFLWGGAIAANQAEGAWNVDGRGPAMTDVTTGGSVKEPRYVTYIDKEGKFVNGAVDYDKLSEFTVSIAGGSNSGKTIYLDDISIYASLEAIIKAHAKSWKTTIR